jgi:hypothetical protein
MTAEIAPRGVRLADLPAAPVLALLDLIPRSGTPETLAALQVRRGPTEGRVLLEVATVALLARIEVDGDCGRSVAVPRAPLAVLRRRCGDAERLVIDRVPEPGLIGLRCFAPDSTVALACPEAEPLPDLPLVDLPEPPTPTAGVDLPLLLDPVLLRRALKVLQDLGCNRVRLELLRHPVVGAALAVHPGPGADLSGSIQLARCLPREAI